MEKDKKVPAEDPPFEDTGGFIALMLILVLNDLLFLFALVFVVVVGFWSLLLLLLLKQESYSFQRLWLFVLLYFCLLLVCMFPPPSSAGAWSHCCVMHYLR